MTAGKMTEEQARVQLEKEIKKQTKVVERLNAKVKEEQKVLRWKEQQLVDLTQGKLENV